MRLLPLLIAATLSISINAQTTTPKDKKPGKIKTYSLPKASDFNTWDVGAHFGTTYPYTDISATPGFNFGFGIDGTKFLSHSVALQARFFHGSLTGTDVNKPDYSFTTKISYDLTLNVLYQFGNVSFLKRIPDLAFYASVGFGVIHYTPEVSIDGERTELDGIYSQYSQPLDTMDYSGTSDIVIPLTFGAKYHVSKNISVFADYSYRMTNSDKLDGFYKLLSDQDNYSYIGVGAVYHLGHKSKHLEWVNPLQTVYNDLYDMKETIDKMGSDTDGDGVADLYDKEPGTPPGTKVYGDGSAVDSDVDGVPDYLDSEIFSEKNAKVDGTGMTIKDGKKIAAEPVATDNVTKSNPAMERDSDGDGVPDFFDRESNTPKGAKVYGDGTSVDSDGDGVSDIADSEPFSEKNSKVDAKGMSLGIRKSSPDVNANVAKTNPATETDTDGDGVVDAYDKEPGTPKSSRVYGDGTSVDSDGDGVPDYRDGEPFSEKNAKVDAFGNGPKIKPTLAVETGGNKKFEDELRKDTDGDGVPDMLDRETFTPKGARVYGDGTSVDSDGDGVPDIKDTEPFSEKNAKVDAFGNNLKPKPALVAETGNKGKSDEEFRKDTDGDGVPDFFDRETNTKKGSRVYGDGTSVDSDSDGVPDISDAEPFSEKNASVDANGKQIHPDGKSMNENNLEANNITANKSTKKNKNRPRNDSTLYENYKDLPSVYFANAEDEITNRNNKTLDYIAHVMQYNPTINFTLLGNTDAIGSKEFNLYLCIKRAEAVKNYLVTKHHIQPDRLAVKHMGNIDSIKGSNPMNRRVDIQVRE